jgi:hypothetical protein
MPNQMISLAVALLNSRTAKSGRILPKVSIVDAPVLPSAYQNDSQGTFVKHFVIEITSVDFAKLNRCDSIDFCPSLVLTLAIVVMNANGRIWVGQKTSGAGLPDLHAHVGWYLGCYQ